MRFSRKPCNISGWHAAQNAGVRQQKKLRMLGKCAKNDKWLACDDNAIAWLAGEAQSLSGPDLL
jgi:hypothetical protein